MNDQPIARTDEKRDAVTRSDNLFTPLVSAIITTYERPTYLRKAVQSVLEQTYENVELVVVDDHSKPPAQQALTEMDLNDLVRVRYVRHDENRGANAARNSGIDAASGEYVAFLDDDDRWEPSKLARQVETFADADEDVGVVYSGVEKISETGSYQRIPPVVDGDMTKSLLCRNVVGGMSVVMVRTDIAADVPLDERFPAWQDLEWYVNLSQRTKFERLPEPLVLYEYTSPNKLSDDLKKKRTARRLFVEKFSSLAAQYGWFFHRKMRAWAAYRVGSAALKQGNYVLAWRLYAVAVMLYPFESMFIKHLAVSMGGEPLHSLARKLQGIS